MNDPKKQYTVEFPSGEAEKMEHCAAQQGLSTPDFVVYCARAFSFGISYATRMLPKQGKAGTSED